MAPVPSESRIDQLSRLRDLWCRLFEAADGGLSQHRRDGFLEIQIGHGLDLILDQGGEDGYRLTRIPRSAAFHMAMPLDASAVRSCHGSPLPYGCCSQERPRLVGRLATIEADVLAAIDHHVVEDLCDGQLVNDLHRQLDESDKERFDRARIGRSSRSTDQRQPPRTWDEVRHVRCSLDRMVSDRSTGLILDESTCASSLPTPARWRMRHACQESAAAGDQAGDVPLYRRVLRISKQPRVNMRRQPLKPTVVDVFNVKL